MKAQDLKLEELIRFSKGLVSLHGRRLVIHDMHAIAQLRRELVEMVGPDQARRILTRFGYFWGQVDAAAMKRLFHWDSMAEWLKAGPELHMFQGVTEVDLKNLEIDENSEHLLMELIWRDSVEAEEHLAELGTAEQPSCWILVGYASGYASFCLGKSVYFVERECRAKGDEFCSAIGKDVDSWGPDVEPYLPFFHADDIQGKILLLTNQIQEKELQLAQHRKKLERALHGPSFSSVEVRSRSFQQVLSLAERVADYDSSILVTGETGVGKEVLARHIHDSSPRANGPFVAVNCAALTETLLESELFGHKAGAFTGATRDRKGLFEEAKAGTIFLDEIGDITQAMQLKLLRVLQEREIMRVGESRTRKVDVRVLAATNRNLEQKVGDGSFRKDLFYRLQVIHIEVPPLRERRDDILPLTRHFVTKCSDRFGLSNIQLDATCVNYLQEYSWPGNIRELENAIEHAVVLSTDKVIRPENLPPSILGLPQNGRVEDPRRPLVEVELEHIQKVLKLTNGNRAQAAKILKIGPATLYRKLNLLKQGDSQK